jgi:hypothetical protein
MDVDIIAYDAYPIGNTWKGNRYFNEVYWTEVLHRNTAAVRSHKDRSLFLCWPPHTSDMAASALRQYQGDTVIYVGEGHGGCTGDDTFHKKLESNWEQIHSEVVPQWDGIHDELFIYKRKGGG